jgi:hypothetical protein
MGLSIPFQGGTIPNTIGLPAGSSSNPALRMTDADTGFAEVTSTNWGWYVNGTERVRLGSGGAVLNTGGFGIGASVAGSDIAFMRHAANVGAFTNNGGSTRALVGGGAAVGSATALPLPTGRVFHVTGTTAITSLTATNLGTGVIVTMIFDASVTVTHGNNIILAGATNFAATANDTLTMAYDGTNFYEVCRSVN